MYNLIKQIKFNLLKETIQDLFVKNRGNTPDRKEKD